MKNKSKKIVISFIFIHSFLLSFSQEKVKGLIIDTNGESIPYATVSEVFRNDSKLSNTVLSDSIGEFIINLHGDAPCLSIMCMGYKSQEKIINLELNEKIKIILELDPLMLNAVAITAQKRTIKLESDRLIYDMSSNPLKDDNVLEALKFVPLISSNGEGFSIIG